MELKPKVDEKKKKLDALKKKAKEMENSQALQSVIDQLNKKQNEYKLMEKSLRKKCDFLEEELKKEAKKKEISSESVREKKEFLKTRIYIIMHISSPQRKYGFVSERANSKTKFKSQIKSILHYWERLWSQG